MTTEKDHELEMGQLFSNKRKVIEEMNEYQRPTEQQKIRLCKIRISKQKEEKTEKHVDKYYIS